jgi:hypothetical protein
MTGSLQLANIGYHTHQDRSITFRLTYLIALSSHHPIVSILRLSRTVHLNAFGTKNKDPSPITRLAMLLFFPIVKSIVWLNRTLGTNYKSSQLEASEGRTDSSLHGEPRPNRLSRIDSRFIAGGHRYCLPYGIPQDDDAGYKKLRLRDTVSPTR